MTGRARGALELGVFLAISALWSWPLVLDPTATVVSGIDTWGTLWALGGAPVEQTAWPLGTDLARSDSVLAVGIGRALAGASPTLLAAALVLLGPAVSAWAAASAARSFGARPPMHLLAGLCFGFGGPAVATLVDGQLYVLLCPWLPLLARDWRRATSPEGRVVDGLRAGLWWTLSLLTSAYVGVAATLWVVGAAVAGMMRRPTRPRAWAGAAAVAFPAGLAYVLAFSTGTTRTGLQGVSARKAMEVGSSELASLVSWAPAVPSDPHAVAAPLGFVTLALVAFAPVVLGAQRGWRLPALLGLVGVLLSLGPTLSLASGLPGAPWLLRPLAALPGGGWFRFPARLLWLPALGFGLVAARVASDLFDRRGRISLVLLPLALLDVLVVGGAPARTAPRVAHPPSALLQAPEGPLLDLFAPSPGRHVDLELWAADRACAWQVWHQQTILARCLDTDTRSDPRAKVSRWLHGALLSGAPAAPTARQLAALGVASVAVHPDTYTGPGAARVLQGLQRVLGPPQASSTDGGERIVLFAVPDPEPDRARAAQALRALEPT